LNRVFDQSRLVEMKTPLMAGEPVSAYDAKTHLPKLLERAAAGESARDLAPAGPRY